MSKNQGFPMIDYKRETSSTQSVFEAKEQFKEIVQRFSRNRFAADLNLELNNESINYILKYCKKNCEKRAE